MGSAPRPQPTLLGPVAGIFGRAYYYEQAGERLHGHAHAYDHAVYVQQGRISIDRDGIAEEIGAGRLVGVPARAVHTLTALEPDTISICLFSVPLGATAAEMREWAE